MNSLAPARYVRACMLEGPGPGPRPGPGSPAGSPRPHTQPLNRTTSGELELTALHGPHAFGYALATSSAEKTPSSSIHLKRYCMDGSSRSSGANSSQYMLLCSLRMPTWYSRQSLPFRFLQHSGRLRRHGVQINQPRAFASAYLDSCTGWLLCAHAMLLVSSSAISAITCPVSLSDLISAPNSTIPFHPLLGVGCVKPVTVGSRARVSDRSLQWNESRATS